LKQSILKHVLDLADPAGGYPASAHRNWLGIADGSVSEIAPAVYAAEIAQTLGASLPHPDATAEFIQARQSRDGFFQNLYPLPGFTTSVYHEYHTCVGIRGLKALGKSPKYDPREWMIGNIRQIGKGGLFGSYWADFYANAFAALEERMPADCERILQDKLLTFQDAKTGWFIQGGDRHFELNNPMTFHATRVFHLMGETVPLADKVLETFMRVQQSDGSWSLGNMHGTFDACATIRMLSDGSARYAQAIEKAGDWALTCRTDDGGFNHFGDNAPEFRAQDSGNLSDMDACYFQVATLAIAGRLPMCVDRTNNWIGWGHTLLRSDSQFKV